MSNFIMNSFQIPNSLVDELMAKMSANALRCYLLIIRKTIGWGKYSDKISITQFLKYLGLKDKRTVYNALNELLSLNLIRANKNNGEITEYFLLYEVEPVTANVDSWDMTSNKNCIVPITKIDTTTDSKKCTSTINIVKNTITTKTIKEPDKKNLDLSGFTQQPSEGVWNDYLEHRKNKRAMLTQSALTVLIKHINDCIDFGFTTDGVLGECMAQGWTGFKADWILKKRANTNSQSKFMTLAERNQIVLESMRS